MPQVLPKNLPHPDSTRTPPPPTREPTCCTQVDRSTAVAHGRTRAASTSSEKQEDVPVHATPLLATDRSLRRAATKWLTPSTAVCGCAVCICISRAAWYDIWPCDPALVTCATRGHRATQPNNTRRM
jgi:hypothetical protein